MNKISKHELAKILKYYGFYEESNIYKIVCPFHEDINASLEVNFDENYWFCYGCQRGGNAFDFFKQVNKNRDPLRVLINYYKTLKSKKVKHIKLKKRSKKYSKKINEDYLQEAKQYYYGLKKDVWNIKSPEKDYLLQRGFTKQTLINNGAKINANNNYPIIFPILDNGIFKGYVCRTTNKATELKRKYLYNKGFSRANTVAGVYESKTVMLVEGYIDFLKARQLGFVNVAAILGWKITANQVELLKKAGVKNIISALDNDKYGKQGTDYLRNFFNVIKFTYPKDIKDMGDLNKKQADKIKKAIRLKIEKLTEERQWV